MHFTEDNDDNDDNIFVKPNDQNDTRIGIIGKCPRGWGKMSQPMDQKAPAPGTSLKGPLLPMSQGLDQNVPWAGNNPEKSSIDTAVPYQRWESSFFKNSFKGM